MTDETTEVRLKKVPAQLWREFKAMCVLRGVTTRAALLELIQWAVKKG